MKRANKALANTRWSGGVRGGKDANQGEQQSEPHMPPAQYGTLGMSEDLTGERKGQL